MVFHRVFGIVQLRELGHHGRKFQHGPLTVLVAFCRARCKPEMVADWTLPSENNKLPVPWCRSPLVQAQAFAPMPNAVRVISGAEAVELAVAPKRVAEGELPAVAELPMLQSPAKTLWGSDSKASAPTK